MMKEVPRRTIPGIPVLILRVMLMAITVFLFVPAAGLPRPNVFLAIAGLIVAFVAEIFLLAGLLKAEPNKGVVLQLFGRYLGTSREPGLRWTNPLLSKHPVSLRVRNFQTEHIKVNDLDGNPIEIAAVIVWQVVDTAEAMFEVDEYVNYVHVQSEAAVRGLATK